MARTVSRQEQGKPVYNVLNDNVLYCPAMNNQWTVSNCFREKMSYNQTSPVVLPKVVIIIEDVVELISKNEEKKKTLDFSLFVSVLISISLSLLPAFLQPHPGPAGLTISPGWFMGHVIMIIIILCLFLVGLYARDISTKDYIIKYQSKDIVEITPKGKCSIYFISRAEMHNRLLYNYEGRYFCNYYQEGVCDNNSIGL